jgi:hypothetical protein
MKKTFYDKLTILDQLTENTNLQIEEVYETYLRQNADILKKPAENGGWSIVQCLEHLNTYSRYYLPFIEKALDNHAESRIEKFCNSWIGNYFIRLMKDSTGKKYKAKALHQPGGMLNPYTVLVEFIDYQKRFLTVMSIARSCDLGQGKIPVSVLPFIKLNLGEVLQFMGAHQQRHLLQARRNYRSQRLSGVSHS